MIELSLPASVEDPATPDPALSAPLHPGDSCPHCGEGRLDYNGLLLLECTHCGRLATTPTVYSC